jgi:type I restriction enzyme S subunit
MWRSKGSLELKYLLSFFLTPLGKHLLEVASPGGAGRNRTLGQEEFKKISICIPSKIREQQKILEILSTWDRAIEFEERFIDEKKQQQKWLTNNLLTGKKRLPGFDDEWQERSLGDCCNGKGCYGINASATKFADHLPRYLRITDIDVNGKYVRENNICVDDQKSLNYRLATDDIVFARTGSVGKSYLYDANDGELVFAGYLIRFQINSQLANSMYIKCLCNSKKYWDWVSIMSARSSQPGINADEYTTFSFNCPPLPEQTAIAKVLSTAGREIELHEKQLKELKRLKQALMQLLLTGIVRVNVQGVS